MKKFTLIALLFLCGCTENQRARGWGGTATIELKSNQKLVTMTWKEDHLWILTRKRHSDESIEEYEFEENSSWGIMQGTVIVKEKQ